MNPEAQAQTAASTPLVHPHFDTMVQRIIQSIEKDRLATLRRDFHTRLRITLTQPESAELIEDLWDFFYDWCVFEQRLLESIRSLAPQEQNVWLSVKDGCLRGLYSVEKIGDNDLKLKELYSGEKFTVTKKSANDFLGIEKGDILEGRIVPDGDAKGFSFVRRPSFHPTEVHAYIKKKVKQFKKSKDFTTYQNWLWLLVGMYLKHRIYNHMPIEKIYDDNSRI